MYGLMHNESQWKSSMGFILASAGSAIGLGAMWKFPYMAGIYGGGAFLLMFLIFTLVQYFVTKDIYIYVCIKS